MLKGWLHCLFTTLKSSFRIEKQMFFFHFSSILQIMLRVIAGKQIRERENKPQNTLSMQWHRDETEAKHTANISV